MKRMVWIVCFLALFALPVAAAPADDPYETQYEASGAAGLQQLLPPEARRRLEAAGVDSADPHWNDALTPDNLFAQIARFLREGGRAPLRAGAVTLGVLLLAAALSTVADRDGAMAGSVGFVAALAVAGGCLTPLFSLLQSCVAALKGAGVFLLSFVPVYAGIFILGGKPATAAGFSALLLGAAEATVQLSSFVVVPLTGAYLAVSLCAGVSPLTGAAKLAESIKKAAFWLMGLTLTLFLGVLSLQTTLQAAGDNLGMKAAKFLLGAVPVVGSALGEALTTLRGCLALLRASVGMYGVVALAACLLPVLLELLLWRAVLLLLAAVCDLTELDRVGGILRAADAVVAVLAGVFLFFGALFILSLTLVLRAGGAA